MMLALEGADPNAIRAMQHFISHGAWDDEAILKRHWQEVDKDLGDEDGVYTLDGSEFPKQGDNSVGVKHQRWGELKTYLSNAPVNTPLETWVRLSGMRWPIETSFEESKQYLGRGSERDRQ